jgi:hypothetical protein
VYTLTCATYYIGNPAPITCQANGSWTAQSGCSLVNPIQANYVIAAGSSTYQATRIVTCGTGYSGSASSVSCSSTGIWTSSSSCVLTSNFCSIPVAGTGYALGTGSLTYGSVYTMNCATGYSGTAASLTCLSSGTWLRLCVGKLRDANCFHRVRSGQRYHYLRRNILHELRNWLLRYLRDSFLSVGRVLVGTK